MKNKNSLVLKLTDLLDRQTGLNDNLQSLLSVPGNSTVCRGCKQSTSLKKSLQYGIRTDLRTLNNDPKSLEELKCNYDANEKAQINFKMPNLAISCKSSNPDEGYFSSFGNIDPACILNNYKDIKVKINHSLNLLTSIVEVLEYLRKKYSDDCKKCKGILKLLKRLLQQFTDFYRSS